MGSCRPTRVRLVFLKLVGKQKRMEIVWWKILVLVLPKCRLMQQGAEKYLTFY